MSFHRCCRLLTLALILVPALMSLRAVAAEPGLPQYLLFQIFLGGPERQTGVFQRGRSNAEILRIARQIAETVRPARTDPDRLLGFAVGPIAMDQGEDDARSVIRGAFDAALATDTAVALHLDDYMFWSQAGWPDGRRLGAAQGTTEWKDWSQSPAGALEIGYMQNVNLAPPLCYESPEVREFTTHWTRDVIGQEVKKQFNRLMEAGKGKLFAGVIAGWESNLAYGYCSLSHLGYSAQNPPADFDHERERVLQRHIERWAKGIYDSGIPRHLIFTHTASIPRRDYEKISAMRSREQIRKMPGSTAFRAFWTAFNNYSNPGFTAYPDEGRFEDIYDAVGRYGRGTWAMAEGTDAIPGPGGAASRPPVDWQTYLARSFNHDAMLVDIFGGFQGEGAGDFQRATESEEALTAYRKFLQGDHLVEDTKP
jgi:hypothetical protein